MAEYKRKVIPITKLDCPNCVATVEKELAKLEGVNSVHINFLMQKIIVDYDPEKIDMPEIEEKIEKLGYRIAYKKYESLPQRILKVFASPDCPTCGIMRQKLRELAEKFKNQIHIYELNIVEAQKWEEYDVMGVPTIIYFSRGSETGRLVGLAEEKEIEARLSELLKAS